MGRFIFWTIIFLVIGGFILHFDVHISFVSNWLGKLPGDFIVQKKKMIIYFPVVSAALMSLSFCLILWFFSKAKK
jgi:H+/Cl- antiporter ClcA